MSLESGVYLITSKVEERPVGRYPIEDLSLLPKRVLALDKNLPPSHAYAHVLNDGDGKYTVKYQNAPVGKHQDRLRAALIPEMVDIKPWKLVPAESYGQDDFLVLREDNDEGWVVEQDNSNFGGFDIAVRPVTSKPNEVFHFQKVDI